MRSHTRPSGRAAAAAAAIAVVGLLVLLPAAVVRAGPVQCFSSGNLCFQAAPTASDATKVDILLATKYTTGWIAVGAGQGMTNADMLVAWRTASGTWTMSRRFSTSRTTPPAAPSAAQAAISIVNATQAAGSDGYHRIVLRRPVARTSSDPSDNAMVNSATMAWSWAYYTGGAAVSGSNLPKHSNEARFTYNPLDAAQPVVFDAALAAGGAPTPGGGTGGAPTTGGDGGASSAEVYIAVHAWCMGIAWTAAAPIGIFISRFLKPKLPKTWFPIHRALLGLATLLALVGYALALAANGVRGAFGSTHGVLGTLVILASVGQAGLGVAIDKLFDPRRTFVPARDKVHWALGYAVVLLALVNTAIGHTLMGTGDLVLAIHVTVVVLGVAAFAYAQVKLGQTHDAGGEHVEMPKSNEGIARG